MTIQEYISEINKEFETGRATEHSYRGYLQTLIKSLVSDVMVTNEPTRVQCGSPDYIITKKDIPVGYIEAKNIGDNDLAGKNKNGNKEQFDRYKRSLDNIIFTDYLDFHFYKDGNFITAIKIGQLQEIPSKGGNKLFESKIVPLTENFEEFNQLIKNFSLEVTQSIKSSKRLAEMMAGKARMLSEVIEKALIADEADTLNPDTTLQSQLHAFKDILIHDITPKDFADIYAQTIAYGMFAARLHDPTLPTFSRQEAAELIPKTNPFLRKLFQYIAGYDLDLRLVWIVDGLADIFRATDVAALLKNFGKSTQTNDPIIHFYETFLSEYDPALRKARGVWYTPEPVVNFIVRAVDDILKTEFNLKDGLADTSKTKIKVKIQTHDKRYNAGLRDYEQEVHKVQILDPATGTGTFLAEVVKQIYKKFEGQKGVWSKYVDEHLVPRLNGFELLMASYAMAHLKLDMLLTETGYKQEKDQRFKIYLTNSLEEHHQDTGTLFANWLSTEANEANKIKRDTPVMVIIGNPPYSGISSNNGEWISNMINDYKYVDGEHFNERKHWLNDDYVKFIRFGQNFIEKNGEGILAFINPHGFLDNPTFRGMRWHLLKTYDKIYTIDLHGNSTKKEISPDGSVDQNVFDIMQGVSINLFIKTDKKKTNELGKIFHHDVYGKREIKYNFLTTNSIETIDFKELNPQKPFLLFVPKNDSGSTEYGKGFRIDKLFSINVTGIVSARDSLVINENKQRLIENFKRFTDLNYSDLEIRNLFFGNKKEGKYLAGDSRGWSLSSARQKIKDNDHSSIIKNICYRPFDIRNIYYSTDMVDWGRIKYMQHFLKGENLGLVIGRQGQVVGSMPWNLSFITKCITDFNLFYRGGGMLFPLYLYPENLDQKNIDQTNHRIPNLNFVEVQKIEKILALKFTTEKEQSKNTFAPIDLLDFIYGIVHSPTYIEKYKEFLKIDFPLIPYPKKAESFWKLVKLGGKLRQIHLLEDDTADAYITKYAIEGDDVVGKIKYNNGKVYINERQYFEGVPENVWNFYIGGYQPAQKWLKDRKGRELSLDDIFHYQKIVVALNSTIRVMDEINKIEIE